jgi:hypothetical protein
LISRLDLRLKHLALISPEDGLAPPCVSRIVNLEPSFSPQPLDFRANLGYILNLQSLWNNRTLASPRSGVRPLETGGSSPWLTGCWLSIYLANVAGTSLNVAGTSLNVASPGTGTSLSCLDRQMGKERHAHLAARQPTVLAV